MLKIYIADDSVVLRGKLKEAFEDRGGIKVVGESGNTGQAITDIHQLEPHAAILDIRMPGGGGLPVLEDIKTRNPAMIAIILTSFTYSQYRQTYMAAGADYFFDKTTDIPRMIDMLADLTLQIVE